MSTSRLYFLDNLRAFVIFLVVVLHGALTYMAYAPEWWYVLDPQNSLFFTALVLLVDVPIMLMMFFVAGYFAYPSLSRRGAAGFVREKFTRIGLPWIFGALVLAPPTAYMIYYSRGVPVSLGQFWASDFWGPLYQQSVYWYLGILFLFFVLLAAGYNFSARLRGLTQKNIPPTLATFILFFGLTTVAAGLVNLYSSLDTWSNNYLFVYQPVRAPLYVGYFALGVYAYLRGWFTTEGYSPSLWRWLALCVVSGLVYLGYRFTVPLPAQTSFVLKSVTVILFNLFCLSSLMAGLAVFRRYVNGQGAFWQGQARNSYGVYYLHPLFLYPLALLFVPLSISIFIKAPAIILLAWVASWAVSALALTRLPGLRRIF
ncbi:MAG: hypothetical protein FOGNACKC_01830 [Anaerolineae bacterium]|nr:hypothetical protein [Anaerolineae bacterium]